MAIANEELFAPVFVVMPFKSGDLDAAIGIANSTRYALGSSVFSATRAHCDYIAARIHAGMVNINDFGVSYLNQGLPFGGVKKSGYGRFAGPEGLLALTQPKAVTRDRLFSLLKTGIPPPLDYPMHKPARSWGFVNALVGFAYAPSIPARAKAILDPHPQLCLILNPPPNIDLTTMESRSVHNPWWRSDSYECLPLSKGQSDSGLGRPLLHILVLDGLDVDFGLHLTGALVSLVPVVADGVGKDGGVAVEADGGDGLFGRVGLEQLLGCVGGTLGLHGLQTRARLLAPKVDRAVRTARGKGAVHIEGDAVDRIDVRLVARHLGMVRIGTTMTLEGKLLHLVVFVWRIVEVLHAHAALDTAERIPVAVRQHSHGSRLVLERTLLLGQRRDRAGLLQTEAQHHAFGHRHHHHVLHIVHRIALFGQRERVHRLRRGWIVDLPDLELLVPPRRQQHTAGDVEPAHAADRVVVLRHHRGLVGVHVKHAAHLVGARRKHLAPVGAPAQVEHGTLVRVLLPWLHGRGRRLVDLVDAHVVVPARHGEKVGGGRKGERAHRVRGTGRDLLVLVARRLGRRRRVDLARRGGWPRAKRVRCGCR
ncbi:hypothetical protein L1887_51709 [Cichorium endivia]|nr:hypothetical protein L1887_51709 [Cichorium endivia]